jgi:hypothetical protein
MTKLVKTLKNSDDKTGSSQIEPKSVNLLKA